MQTWLRCYNIVRLNQPKAHIKLEEHKPVK
jgi:hypothetical protein